ncbi:MAG TPA: hypothetical protein ENI23_10015 [bacterium]|nr:hypothetical protein [bacterium]
MALVMVLKNMNYDDIAMIDAGFWAIYRKIKLQGGIFSFKNHEYQKEWMANDTKRVCYMKATQGGVSEVEILRSTHGLIFKKYKQGVLVFFPTSDDVGDFSKSRWNPLILANPEYIGRYVRAGSTTGKGKGTDTTFLKKIGDGFLYLRGARLSQSLDGSEKVSSKISSIPVDRCVFDEVDFMDEAVIDKALGRMAHSENKEEVYISNPTLPDFGIDKIFKKSDQRHLFRKCECGELTCAELSFPECVKIRPDGTGYIGCNKCGKEVGFADSEWVPAERDNTGYMRGYRWSQLSSIYNDPAEILEQYNNPPHGLGDIVRLRLGLPYVATEDKLSKDRVYECCGPYMMPTSSMSQCAMGVDVGKMKHIVIGERTGRDRYDILKTIRLSKWEDIHDIARSFNVKFAVIDIRPYEDEARRFQKAELYKIFLCEYNDSSPTSPVFNADGIVKVNRTEILDATHRLIIEQTVKLPRRSAELDVFVQQLCNTAKVLETNKRNNTSIYRYREVGSSGDHYRHALNYFYLAASKIGIARSNQRPRQKQAINENTKM